jgi:hypothetical protein
MCVAFSLLFANVHWQDFVRSPGAGSRDAH